MVFLSYMVILGNLSTVAFRWDSHRFIASQADWEAKKLFVNTVRAQTSAPEVILLVKATTISRFCSDETISLFQSNW